MIAWLWRMIVDNFSLCHHKWEVIRESCLTNDDGDVNGKMFTLQCEHCGDIKFRKITP